MRREDNASPTPPSALVDRTRFRGRRWWPPWTGVSRSGFLGRRRGDVRPVATRVLLALELLKHELSCSDEQICSRFRTDLAVMYACGITEVQVDRSQGHFVLPEVLAQFRSRLDEALMEELLTIQATAAIEAGVVSPAHLVVDTFPSEQGSQRVNDAATLYRAKKKSSRSSRTLPTRDRQGQRP